MTPALGDPVQSRYVGCIPPPPSLQTWFWSLDLPGGGFQHACAQDTHACSRVSSLGKLPSLLAGSPLKSWLLLERQPGFSGKSRNWLHGAGVLGQGEARRPPTPAFGLAPPGATGSMALRWGYFTIINSQPHCSWDTAAVQIELVVPFQPCLKFLHF